MPPWTSSKIEMLRALLGGVKTIQDTIVDDAEIISVAAASQLKIIRSCAWTYVRAPATTWSRQSGRFITAGVVMIPSSWVIITPCRHEILPVSERSAGFWALPGRFA